MLPLPVVRYLEFQSTLPSRRATNVIWCRKGAHENDFGAYYYASYILPDGPQFGGRFFI